MPAPAPAPEYAELTSLAFAHLESAPPVYGALPSLGSLGLGAVDVRAFAVEFLAKQVLGKVKDYAAANKDALARQVADAARRLTEMIVDRGVEFIDSIDGD